MSTEYYFAFPDKDIVLDGTGSVFIGRARSESFAWCMGNEFFGMESVRDFQERNPGMVIKDIEDNTVSLAEFERIVAPYQKDQILTRPEDSHAVSLDTSVIHLTTAIQPWYLATFPNDEVGRELNPSVTFGELYKAMEEGRSVYSALGGGDTVIRERVFEKLAELQGVDYRDIYDLWMDGPKHSLNSLIQSAESRVASSQQSTVGPVFLFEENRSGDRMGKPGDAKNVYYANWFQYYSLTSAGIPRREQFSLEFSNQGKALLGGGNERGKVIQDFADKQKGRDVVVLSIEYSRKDLKERIFDAISKFEKDHLSVMVLPSWQKYSAELGHSR